MITKQSYKKIILGNLFLGIVSASIATPSYATETAEGVSFSISQQSFSRSSKTELREPVGHILNMLSEQLVILQVKWKPQVHQFNYPELNDLFGQYKPEPMEIHDVWLLNCLFEKCGDNFEILTEIAKAGYAEAQFQVGMVLRYEDEENKKELAKELMHRAAAQGHVSSIYELSDAYNRTYYEFNLVQNPRLAFLLCQEAAALGLDEAQLDLASVPLDGKFGQGKDFDKAKQQIQALAEKGCNPAQERYAYLESMSKENYEYLSNM